MSEDITLGQEEQTEEDIEKLVAVRMDKLEELKSSGKNPFNITKFDINNNSKKIKANFKEGDELEVKIAGRIMSKRGHGKASFLNLQDSFGQIQLYVKLDEVGEETYDEFKKYDIGDIIGVEGNIFITHTGEVTVKAKKITLLTKSLRPLPEKWHGLKDTDLRYRQRYVDLIVNPDVKKTFLTRTKILKLIRRFLDDKGYLEVDTPVLSTIAGGATARPFITHHNTLNMDMYLRIANELYLKRLIVGGFDKVYEMGKMFRNEGISIKHNPEFTNIELYSAYEDYNDMMNITEELLSSLVMELYGKYEIEYQGTKINLAPGFKKITMTDAIKEVTGIDFNAINTDEEAKEVAKKLNVEIKKNKSSRGDIMNEIFESKVEDTLIQPTFLCDYPVEVSPLTKRKESDPRLVERFELFIGGREYANAYSELNDPIDQKERFNAQVVMREAGDEEANMMDEDFINALEYGMPPTGGLGIGVDRLIMLLTDSYSIRDILLFPTMKPKV